MAELRSGGTDLGEAVRELLGSIERRDPELVASARNSRAWTQAADEAQRAHTDAVYTVPGTQGSEVVVYIDSNIWATELSLQSELLRLKMNMALADSAKQAGSFDSAADNERIKKLRFAASREHYRSARPEDTSTQKQLLDEHLRYNVEPLPLTPEEEAQIEAQVAAIENPQVRKAAHDAMRADAMLKKALRDS
ncbi:MAG: hypothetical protein ACI36W_02905 [Coriobacteriales bacterium]